MFYNCLIVGKLKYENIEKNERTRITNVRMMISPITGELIPADTIEQHMKINLLDPRYKEQKERLFTEKRHQEEVFTVGSSMVSNLKEMAQRRSDIFGPSTQETSIGEKIEELNPNTMNASKQSKSVVSNAPVVNHPKPNIPIQPAKPPSHSANANIITKVPG